MRPPFQPTDEALGFEHSDEADEHREENPAAVIPPTPTARDWHAWDVPTIRMPTSAGTPEGFRAWWGSATFPRWLKASLLGDRIYLELRAAPDAMILEIPTRATTPEGFRDWATSDEFPERGRISLLDQEIFIDMSPEEIETHIKVKGEIAASSPT